MEREFTQQGATPRALEDWRKIISEDLIGDKRTRRGGKILRDTLDKFAESGEGGETAKLARKYFRRSIQMGKIEQALTSAKRMADRTSGDEALHIKSRFDTMLRADERAVARGKPAQFDPEMREFLKRVAETGSFEKALRWFGKLSPDSGLSKLAHLAAGIGTGGAYVVPQMALGAGAFTAKKAAAKIPMKNVEALKRIIAESHKHPPQVTAKAKAMLEAMTRGTVAATQ
jgi:hypothetical protein